MKMQVSVGLLLMTTMSGAGDLAEEIRCQEIGFSLAAESRNAELFASYIDPDARFVGNSVMRGPSEVASAWAAFFAADGPTIKWRPQFVEVLEDGALALTRGPYRVVTMDDRGVQTEHWGTFNSVWRRHADGNWKVVFDAGNQSSEPPAELVRQLLDQGNDCP
ncbi:MAG: nuclear transport factor 2 family protein [Gammaproteobacteria bacterium]|nr:nuclear transport factor 2 family protein [Gammaproteobacteria bacterium]MDH5304567.1 nuclear transport factor 2 family protein [Gammaproteobacteria bacterium]MDH5322573.1 nuclear transport factor 2 family protein [Gammaproteobacteria bacterium]